jgi:geranyl-CoA carboxylase alpha subunit
LAGLIWLETHRDPRHARPGMPAAWSNSHSTRASFELRCGARSWRISAEQRGSSWSISTGTSSSSLRVLGHEGVQLRFECDARRRTAHFAWADTGELQLELDAYTWTFAEHRPHESAANSEGSDGTVRAPTMGRVLAVAVALGQVVESGARLLTLEAMKIESTVLAPIAGTIAELRIAVGDQVDKRQVLVKIEPASN